MEINTSVPSNTIGDTIKRILQPRKRDRQLSDDAYMLETFNMPDYIKRPRRQTKRVKWNEKTTEYFYSALKICGPNMSLIQQHLPQFTKRQLLLKYHHERRKDPIAIELAVEVYKERLDPIIVTGENVPSRPLSITKQLEIHDMRTISPLENACNTTGLYELLNQI